jgi:O-antigen/teichoic acid export membrane protein
MDVVLARVLGAAGYGVFILTISVAVPLMRLAQSGLGTIVVREVAGSMAHGDTGTARSAMAGALTITIVGSGLVGAAVVSPFGRSLLDQMFPEARLSSVAVPLALIIGGSAIVGILAKALRGLYAYTLSALFDNNLSMRILVVPAVLIAVGLVGYQLTASRALTLTALGYLVSAALALVALKRATRAFERRRLSWTTVRVLLSSSWPLLLSALIMVISQRADVWALGAASEPSEVGTYGAASRLALAIGVPLTVMNGVMSPIISHMWRTKELQALERRLRVATTAATLPAFAAVALFLFAGPAILGLAFGDSYRSAAVPLTILTLGVAVSVMTGSCGLVLGLTGHERWSMFATLTAGALTIALVFPAAFAFGPVGVATVVATGTALGNVMQVVLARKKTGMYTHASVRVGANYVRHLRRARRTTNEDGPRP